MIATIAELARGGASDSALSALLRRVALTPAEHWIAFVDCVTCRDPMSAEDALRLASELPIAAADLLARFGDAS